MEITTIKFITAAKESKMKPHQKQEEWLMQNVMEQYHDPGVKVE